MKRECDMLKLYTFLLCVHMTITLKCSAYDKKKILHAYITHILQFPVKCGCTSFCSVEATKNIKFAYKKLKRRFFSLLANEN